MTNKNAIRQATNMVNIKGTLVKKTYDEDEYKKTGIIKLTMEINTGDNNIVEVSSYTKPLKADGTENGFYKRFVTIIEEYKEGDIVVVNSNENFQGGSLRMNEYYSPSGEYRSRLQVNVLSINRARKQDLELPDEATFHLEGVITYMERELDKEENETGALIIRLTSPEYKGKASIYELKATKNIEKIEKVYEVGQTALFIGNIINEVIVEHKKVEMAFGDDYEDIITTVTSGLEITRGGFPLDPEEDEKAYTPQQIKLSLAEREAYLEDQRKKAENKGKSPSQGSQGAYGAGNVADNALGSDDDIPF